MTTHEPRGFFARFRALIRGTFGVWVRDRERQNPQAVYEQAIQERTRQYRELKQAVAGILYMRNKIQADLAERRAEVAQLREDTQRCVERGEDDVALALIGQRQAIDEEIARAEEELQAVSHEASEAKTNLVRFREEIRSLEREKVRILATLANARARRRIQEAFEGLSVDADMRALESVRDYVARVSTEGRLTEELEEDTDLRRRVSEIRSEAETEAQRTELAELKRRVRPQLAEPQPITTPIPTRETVTVPVTAR
ncbi:MAG: PspA/IM30 family protein [Deltaproteobacteria bacterium]|nr:PspA/IM30 family protein [Deltaproteobacteria bacterium]